MVRIKSNGLVCFLDALFEATDLAVHAGAERAGFGVRGIKAARFVYCFFPVVVSFLFSRGVGTSQGCCERPRLLWGEFLATRRLGEGGDHEPRVRRHLAAELLCPFPVGQGLSLIAGL